MEVDVGEEGDGVLDEGLQLADLRLLHGGEFHLFDDLC